jgi:hypothetical protein
VIHALGANDTVDISYDGTNYWYDDDGNSSDNDATKVNDTITERVTITLYKGATLTFHTKKVDTNVTGEARLYFPGSLHIVGGFKDTITFKDDATGGKGGAQITGDLVFTGRGHGDEFTIEAPVDPAKPTEVGGHVSIDTGDDNDAVTVTVNGLDITGAGSNFSLSTGNDATIDLENITLNDGNVTIETGKQQRPGAPGGATVDVDVVDTNGGMLRLTTGPRDDTITVKNLVTDGGNLILLSDAGRLKPGGSDIITLDTLRLGNGNVTLRAGARPDEVYVDDVLTGGDVFTDLDAGHDTLRIGDLAASQVRNLWIRGHAGDDWIFVQRVTATRNLGIRTHKGNDRVRIGGTGPGGAPTVDADSMEIHTGPHNDEVEFRPVRVSQPRKFRVRGGPGRDRTAGERHLPRAYRRRLRKFRFRNW